ncbi:hypothetical protein SKAU_G00295120 [Synaphobranchus kaupii]|uniref:C2H2-type domain-containing protein n=1 Tax=Synaphobranchus kaupii TaxID=118154 RepID=A0A9Q1EUM0_SYNKA|nr:hypothetical protein SKAU_G00295120 [Synaphobranchus kaupii]
MSTCVTLHLQTQVASIMEVLAKSAVVEIGKAIDEGTALLLLEMSRSKKENETLKWRLLELEKELLEARRGGNRATARDRIRSVKVQVRDEIRGPDNSYDSVFGKEWSIGLWKDGELTAKKEEEAPLQPVINEEATQTVEDRQDLFPIKVELFEENLEDSDPQGGLKITGGLEPERDSTERQHGEESDPQPASAEVTEEPYTRPTAAGGRLEQHTLPVTMEGTAEPHTLPAPPESTAGSEDAHRNLLCDNETNVAKRGGRNRLACKHCGRNFSYFSIVQKHQQTCSSRSGKHFCEKAEKPFSCNGCGKYYLEKWRLNSHLCSRHTNEPYKCIDCGNGFSQEVHLSLHQCSHRREKPYSCVKSGENSSQKSKFESQQHNCRVGNFYRCLVCGKYFSRRDSLHVHQRTVHTGEKPYSCAECGKNFSQKGNLQKHKVIHTGEKPYQCLECGKSFTEKGNLQKHHLIHRGVKPHRCRECGKCFSRKGHLNSHEQQHRRETT